MCKEALKHSGDGQLVGRLVVCNERLPPSATRMAAVASTYEVDCLPLVRVREALPLGGHRERRKGARP